LKWVQRLGWLNKPILVSTMIIELLPLFVFFHRRMIWVVFPTCAAMHFGIFLASGIFFWKWILTNFALLALCFKGLPAQCQDLFSRKDTAWGCLAIVLLTPWCSRPMQLGWYDCSFNSHYDIEVQCEGGAIYPLERSFMSPYDLNFAQNKLGYLNPDPVVVGTLGATADPLILSELNNARSLDDVIQLEQRLGKVHHSPKMASQFDRFLQNYFRNLNKMSTKPISPFGLSAPHHIWFPVQENGYCMQQSVEKVLVYHIRTLYQNNKIEQLSRELIHEVEIY